MSMFNTGDILETIEMFTQENLDVRTVTMGISLLDCIDPDPARACEKVYRKITARAAKLVPTVDAIAAEYGIPIINKRISVTPIAMLLGACPDADPKALDAAGKAVGVNFVGGYTALVHKGFSAGDKRLIASIPRALAQTDIVCSSVNIGATKAGLNMDAVKMMGQAIRKTAEMTADRQCIGAAKLVVFCNAPEDNPFMAGAFHGAGEPDCEIHVGVSGPGAVRAALARLPKDAPIDEVASLVKRTAFKITRVGQLVANLVSRELGVPAGIIDLSLAPTPAIGDSVANILEEMGLETCGCCGTTACLALGDLRLLRHHRLPGPAQRRRQKGRRHGIQPCGRPVGGVYPRQRGRRHDPRRRDRLPDHRKAGGHDRRVQRGHRHGHHPRRHPRLGHQRPDRRRGGHRHGQLQDHRGACDPRHRPQGRRKAGLWRPAGLPLGVHQPGRPAARPHAVPQELTARNA